MVGKVRDFLNQSPPWVSYGAVGLALLLVVGFVVIRAMPERSGAKETDRHFYCPDTQDGFTLTAQEARNQMRESAKARPGQPVMLKNPKSGQYTAVPGLRCPKCKAYFEIPEKEGGLFPSSWRDVCPKCNYSESREQAVAVARKQQKEGKYDPNKMPAFMREDIDKALQEQGGK